MTVCLSLGINLKILLFVYYFYTIAIVVHHIDIILYVAWQMMAKILMEDKRLIGVKGKLYSVCALL